MEEIGEIADEMGEIADTVDNLLHALELPMPTAFHVQQMKSALPDVIKRLRAVYVKTTGENPWEE